MTLSFPVPVTLSDVKYVISITMIGSVSDGVNKSTAMVTESYQLMTILNRLMTESGVIKVALPDGTEMQLRTEKERDRLLDGKLDKTGGVITKDLQALGIKQETTGKANYFRFLDPSNVGRALIGFGGGTDDLSFSNLKSGVSLKISSDGRVLINSSDVMKVGDFGVGSSGSDIDIHNLRYNGFFTASGFSPTSPATVYFGMSSFNTAKTHGMMLSARMKTLRLTIIENNVSSQYDVYHTGNTTKDSNGNLKAASPIVKVFADHIETNDEAEGVTMQKLGTGHYLIKGVVGFNADGAWGINNGFVIPQDHNGKNMVLIDYEVRPDGDIEVFVFHQQNVDMPERFQNKRIKYIDKDGNPVYYENYEPCDVPESRWIDMRVEMPVNSIYNLKQAEAERLAKEEAERQAEEEAKNAEIEAEEDI
ncbi:TPA: hypothetical protein ACHWKK_003813 [Providencia stuartii]|uniref:phage tail fiber protein n=1 Tax=Providencia stuartii TaxID=588 RepID=UPI002DB6A6B9|nr:hypothetical protein [Providencia stuartii]WRV51077.1 hypothetical protein VQ573_15655 [Providencia stuartii]